MSKIVTQVRKGFFLDSVALMRISQTIAGLPGVEEAASDDGDAGEQGDYGGGGSSRCAR